MQAADRDLVPPEAADSGAEPIVEVSEDDVAVSPRQPMESSSIEEVSEDDVAVSPRQLDTSGSEPTESSSIEEVSEDDVAASPRQLDTSGPEPTESSPSEALPPLEVIMREVIHFCYSPFLK